MAPTAVVDTNVLLNLGTPVVDGRPIAPSGEDPFVAVLSAYEIHVPQYVLGEAATDDDLPAAAADAVLRAADRLQTREVEPVAVPELDEGERRAIRLANDLSAPLFVTDEFNSTNYLLVALSLDSRETLFTTPHLLCRLAETDLLDERYVEQLLSYYVETKGWDERYVSGLRGRYFSE